MKFAAGFLIVMFVYSVAFVFGFMIKETTTIIGVLLVLLVLMLWVEYLLKRKMKNSIKT